MATTIIPRKIDIRYHEAFSDEAVKRIFTELLSLAEMGWASGFTVRYQGRTLLG